MASKSEAVYREILTRVSEGFWEAGEQIPSERDLCRLFDVSRVTVRSAIATLVGEGILVHHEGRQGTFVAEHPKGGGSPLVGIALDNHTPAFASRLLEGIHDSLWRGGYHSLYCNTHLSTVVVEKITSMIEGGIAGLIYSPHLTDETVNAAVFALAERAHIPLVQLDRHLDAVQASKVCCDNRSAMHTLGSRLVERGVKRVLVLTGITTSSTAQRLEGLSINPELHIDTAAVDELAYYTDGRIQFLEGEPPLEGYEAIVGVNKSLGSIAQQLQEERNLSTLTVGVDADESEVINDLAVIQPLYHIGSLAASLLIDHIVDPQLPPTTVLVEASQWP